LGNKHGDPTYIKLGLYKGELDLYDTNTSFPMASRTVLLEGLEKPAECWINKKVDDKEWGPKIKAGQDLIQTLT